MSRLVFLARHAEVERDEPWRFRGQGDRPLSERGREQARVVARVLAGRSFDALYCSPLARCRQTLAPLALAAGREPRILAELAEIDLGQWDGLSVDEVERRFPGAYAARGADLGGFRPAGGESFEDLRARAEKALAHMLAEPGERILAMTHAGIIRVLLCAVLGLSTAEVFRFEAACASLSCLAFGPHGARVRFVNREPLHA